MNKHEYTGERPFWYDGKMVNEVGFCEDFLQKHPKVRYAYLRTGHHAAKSEQIQTQKHISPHSKVGLPESASALLFSFPKSGGTI